MIIFKLNNNLSQYITEKKRLGKTIGFVPTMGALHQGHMALINTAKQGCDIVVCSIFVNPTQFNNSKDFEKYPITIDADIDLLEKNGCDILYLPTVEDIYTSGVEDLTKYELGFLETVYDGAFRPGHFQGVCNVVERLFKAVEPNMAFFGLKDYQQCMVIKKLVSIMQWEHKLELVFCETLREYDGLAMSSRNMRLTEAQRKLAPIIYKNLQYIKQNITVGELDFLTDFVKKDLEKNGFRVDYVDIADAENLIKVDKYDGSQKLVCLIAAFVGDVRLIDNLLLN